MGTDHGKAALGAATVSSWCEHVGQALHPSAVRLLVSADGGSSNGSRTRLWKTELAALATRQTPYQPHRVQRIGRNYAVDLGATDADGPLQASTLI